MNERKKKTSGKGLAENVLTQTKAEKKRKVADAVARPPRFSCSSARLNLLASKENILESPFPAKICCRSENKPNKLGARESEVMNEITPIFHAYL